MSTIRRRARRSSGVGGSVSTTLRQYVRGIAGGLLLGLPPLFTMEMWFYGFLLSSWKIVVLIAFTFIIVVGYSAFSGFRRERTWPDLILDCVETMGIAAVVSALALVLLGRIEAGIALRDAIGKIGLQMIPISLGVSLAGAQLADPNDNGEDAADRGTSLEPPVGPYGRFFVVVGGALFLALNVAPTEETAFLSVHASWWLLVLVVLISLTLSYAMVFYANFRGGRKAAAGDSPLDHPVTETVVAYALSLLVSGLLVWSFGQPANTTVYAVLARIVLLGVVASFGGAAGRLLLGGKAAGKGRA